ncbi:tape measure protein [Klebsiella aerogenes]|uniref:tape measure protein n=1 Tax=Klebsiella aerogenes TaxID=548 RepID=UPI003A9071ED
MVIRELLIRLGLQGTEQTGRDLDKIDGKVHNVTESFRGLGAVLTGLLAGISIKSIIDVADEMQNLRSQIGNSTGDMDNAASKLDELTRHANDGRVSVEAYTGSWAKMNSGIKQFGGDADDTTKFMDTLSAAFVSNGTATESANAALFQLSQTMQGGVVQGEEMNSLIDAQGELFNDIAKAIAGNVQNYKKMQSQGLVTAEMLLKAVNQFYDKYTSRVKTMPMTVQQSLTIIGNNWKLFTDRLNRESQIIPKIAGMFLWMSNKAEYAMQIVIDALGGAENAVKLLTVAIGAAGLLGAIWLLPAAFAALTSPITVTIGALVLLYAVAEDVYRWFNGKSSVFGKAAGPVSDYEKQIKSLTAFLADLKFIAVGALKALVDLSDYISGSQDFTSDIGNKLGTSKFGPWFKRKFWESNENAVFNDDGTLNGKETFSNMLDFFHAKVQSSGFYSAQEINRNNSVGLLPPAPSSSPQVTVTIGSIEVPAGTSAEQASFLRDVAKESFSSVGSDHFTSDMLFNRGVTR